MSVNVESTLTLKGKTDELMKMLKYLINNEYFDSDFDLSELGELSDEELEEYIIEQDNEINLTMVGPYGRYGELSDTRIFEGLADVSPNASFKGELCRGWTPTEYGILSGIFKNKKLNLTHIVTYGLLDSYVEYVKSIISIEKFCELFHIDEEDFDIYDYRYFFANEYLDDVSLDVFKEYFAYAKIEKAELKQALEILIKSEIEDCSSYIRRKGEEQAETWVYDPLDVKSKNKPRSSGEKLAREISDKPDSIEIEGKKIVTTWCDYLDYYIKENGGIIKSTVVLDTDYIIIGDCISEEGSGKTRRALELNITKGKNIIALTDKEFKNMVK